MDVRNLSPGASATVLSSSFELPVRVADGDKLAIWMPDRTVSLQSTPAYSIRFANTDISWENGFNVLETL